MAEKKPKKPQTAFDAALLLVIEDLIERGQIPVLEEFSTQMGFNNSTQLRDFRKGRINFPRNRQAETTKILYNTFNVSSSFLLFGQGPMYTENKPYVAGTTLSKLEEHANVLNIGRIRRVKELEAENQHLKEQLAVKQSALSPLKISEVFFARTAAVQEVALELLAGLAGMSVEEVFAKVGNKALEIEAAFAGGGNAYSDRIQRSVGGSSS